MSFQYLVNCFALDMLAVFLLDVLLNKHLVSDFHGFAAYMPYIDIFASHWESDRFAQYLRFRSEDNEW